MPRLLPLLFCACSLHARVFFVSLDGLGWDAFTNDPVAQELTALHALAQRGASAAGMRPHYPSTTSNSHAALFTGVWGDASGIMSNSMPATPRREHTILDRVNGYRSDALRVEPIWVAAGRQGISTVALQVTQAYPFRPMSVGENLKTPPVVVNGYQTKLVAPAAYLHEGEVRTEPCRTAAIRCFTWAAGPLRLHGVLRRTNGQLAATVSSEGNPGEVTASLHATETEPPQRRELARHFSDGLYIAQVPGYTAAALYFRLFECAEDGSRFFLYQSPLHELGIHHGSDDGRALAAQLIRDAGGFIGNGPEASMLKGPHRLGPPLWKGGDGEAERRYLEIVELITRQYIRHATWLLDRFHPELFVGYLAYPDETEHAWKGAGAVNPRYDDYRRWAYAIVNRYTEFYIRAARPQDHVVFTSDHGMAPVTRDVAINYALRNAGLLAAGADGKPDPARTRAIEVRNCVFINTTDWKGGIVKPAGRTAAMAEVKRALSALRDPATGDAVISRVYDTAEDAVHFGYGGPNGADLCFDYRPGYVGESAPLDPPLIRVRPAPSGEHGFDPTRLDMQSILIAAGPQFPAGLEWTGMRSIDVAPLVARLLGITLSAPQSGKTSR